MTECDSGQRVEPVLGGLVARSELEPDQDHWVGNVNTIVQ